jgi:hypothetical protein
LLVKKGKTVRVMNEAEVADVLIEEIRRIR